jgi:hypothetical protein
MMTVAASKSTDKCFCVELFFSFCFVERKEKKLGFACKQLHGMARGSEQRRGKKSWSEEAITKFAKSQSSQLLTNRLW